MKKISYLKPLFLFAVISLIITTLSRILLFVIYSDRILEVDNCWLVFPIGLHMDLILISYLSFIPAILVSFTPEKFLKPVNKFLAGYFIIFLFLYLFMEATTPEFIAQYDTRPNKLFLNYLIYPKEIATMLFKGHLLAIAIVLIISVAALYFGFKKGTKYFAFPEPLTPYKYRLIFFPLLAFLLFCGARGSLFTRRPLNPSNAVFSNDQLTNVLGLNSFYTVIYSGYGLKNETDPTKLYGKMGEQEAIDRVKKYMNVPDSLFNYPDIPLLHKQTPDSIAKRPYNLVIFLQESLGAEYVGCLGGMPLTPNIDKLREEGLLFTNLYCTGTRSVRGIEAVTTGFFPSPSESVVKLSNSQKGFFTLANLLKRAGYNTSFVYGGMANFDNMASFFNGNGFDNILDEQVLDRDKNTYAFKGTWGYSDEDLVTKANDYYKSLGSKPFFSLMFSSSNHDPFEFPDGRIELYEEPKNTVHNAMKYADYAIGRFFELAKNEEYFKNTIFVIIADHNTRTYGKNLVPIHKFHIPALIIGPTVPLNSSYDKLCSQVDIAPTLLDVMGMVAETPMGGRNLRQLPDSVPGRAIMQFHDINAFRVGDEVVILQPEQQPQQFKLENDTTFIPSTLDKELAKDALGHIIAADYMYKKGKYRLPAENKK